MPLKKLVYRIIDEKAENKHWLNNPIGNFISILILLSVVAIILESFQELRTAYGAWFYSFELFAIVVFSTEYALRFWTADMRYPNKRTWAARLAFILSGMAIVDLLAILPFYLELLATSGLVAFDMRVLRAIRLMRLLRIFKMSRYSRSFRLVTEVLRDKKEELLITLFMCLILLILSSAIMYNIEHEAQPEAFPNIVATFWWAVATLTTVGYGDVYPVTGWGKLMSGLIAILGIGMVALPAGIVSSSFVDKINEEKKRKAQEEKKAYKYCPHCGEELPHS